MLSVQITTRCNMACRHCCYSCSPESGSDMPWGTFLAALERAAEIGGETPEVNLSGGEPTLHPEFLDMMCRGIVRGVRPSVITNGSTPIARALASLAKHGTIHAGVSVDEFHAPFPGRDEIEAAFMGGFDLIDAFFPLEDLLEGSGSPWGYRRPWTLDSRFVRRGGKLVAAQGRAAKLGAIAVEACPCPEPLVRVDGSVFRCGCGDAPWIGNVFLSASSWDIHKCPREL